MSLSLAQKGFIAKVGAFAAADMAVTGILASLKCAQAILESGWGTTALATQANALFGIKADSRWGGSIYAIKTKEYMDGKEITVTAIFRAYNDWAHSLSDHSAFLIANPRYAAVIGEKSYKTACAAIHAAGYATDPAYTEKLIRIIEQYNLTEFDAVSGKDEVNMNIVQDFIPIGRRNRPGRVNPMLFVTVHETGNTGKGSNARSHANYLKGDAAANLPVSWHYTVDDAATYQHLPETEDAFHAGDGGGNGNRQSIGIEICVNSDGDFQKAVDRTAALVADICTRRNIPFANVRQHFDWSGKNCPQSIRAGRPHNWSVFLEKVQAAMKPAPAPAPAPPASETVNFDLFGTEVKIDGMIQNGRSFVAARQLLEAMGGYSVDWNGTASTVIVRRTAN